jgi:hypothetical protein
MIKKHIITSGCSFTRQYRRIGFNGTDSDFLEDEFKFWRWPHHIQNNYPNYKVYNLGNPTNDNFVIAQSVIKKISDLLKEGISPTDIKVIVQWSDQNRNSFFISKDIANLYNIEVVNKHEKNGEDWSHLNAFAENNHFDERWGYYVLTANAGINTYHDLNDVLNFKYTSFEEASIRFFSNIILIQNFCKVNNILDIFMFNLSYNFITDNSPKYYNDIKKIYLEKEVPKFFISFKSQNPYLSYLYENIDLGNFWFYKNKNTNVGGQLEWAISEFEYKNDKRLFMEHDYINDNKIEFCKKNKLIFPIGHVSSEMNKKFVDNVLNNILKK